LKSINVKFNRFWAHLEKFAEISHGGVTILIVFLYFLSLELEEEEIDYLEQDFIILKSFII